MESGIFEAPCPFCGEMVKIPTYLNFKHNKYGKNINVNFLDEKTRRWREIYIKLKNTCPVCDNKVVVKIKFHRFVGFTDMVGAGDFEEVEWGGVVEFGCEAICIFCNGTGRVEKKIGEHTMVEACAYCKGLGEIYR